MAIEFNTREYVFSHGKTPRGRGSWAFFPSNAFVLDEAMWAPSSITYADAKRWVREDLKARNVTTATIYVGS